MSDDAHENRSQLLAEIDTLRQRLHAYERRPAERLLRAQKRLREAVWSMESSEDLQRVLSTLKESLQELELPFLDCGVNLVSAQSGSLTASINSLNPQGQWAMNADSLWGQELVAIFWQDGRPVYRRDLDTEDAYGERELFPRYFGHPVRSVVDVPFAQGTLAVNSDRPDAFSAADIAALQHLAAVLEEAFQRRQDFQRLEARQRELEAEISSRRQAEQALRERESQYRALFDQSSAGIYLHDRQGRILDANTMACQQTGYSREELLQSTVFDLHPPRTDLPNPPREEILRQWDQWQPGQRHTVRAEHQRKDGSTFPVDISTSLVCLPDQYIIQAMVADTSQQQRDEALQAIRERLRDVFWQMHSSADIPEALKALYGEMKHLFPQMKNCSVQVRQTDADAGASAWLTYAITEARVTDVSIRQLHARKHAEAVETCWREQRPVYRPDLAGDDPYREADQLRSIAPEVRSVLDVPFAQGTLAVNSHQSRAYHPEDIVTLTELAQLLSAGLARIAELRSAERYRTLVETPADIVVMHLALDGRCLYVSPQLQTLTGYQPEAFYSDPARWRQCIHPADAEAAEQALQRVVSGDSQERGEIRVLTRQGATLWILRTLSPVRDAAGQLESVQVLLQDITERKRAEDEREQLQAQLMQAQKIESLGRLAGGIAHDFNNMLSVILGHTEIALAGLDPSQPLCDHLQAIRTSARRSADLTRQLLGFARRQIAAPRVLEFNNTVDDMLGMLRRLIGEDVELVWLPGHRVGAIRMDPAQLDQILANLCINARDAMPDGGRITLKTGTASLDSPCCAAYGIVPGEYACLTVRDNGCGMDPETLASIFEPFFTTKGVGQGTGLGLPTVHGIVQQNDGAIDIDSEPGAGTTVRIYLPQHGHKVELAPAHRQRKVSTDSGRGTILLVEDEVALLRMTATMLERLGYAVLATNSPREGLRLADAQAERIDLLMTDVVMPEMSGRELAQMLLSRYPHLKRLFMSGYTADVVAHHGLPDPGVHFIQKPFSMKQLATSLETVMQYRGGAPKGDQVTSRQVRPAAEKSGAVQGEQAQPGAAQSGKAQQERPRSSATPGDRDA